MSKTSLVIVTVGLLLAGFGCGSAMRTQICHAERIDLVEYQTYAFLDQSGKPARLDDPFMKTPDLRLQIREVIVEKMAERGFERARINEADFLIAIHAGSGDHLDDEMTRWRYRYAKYWHFEDDRSYPEGALILDFFDEGNNTLFWRGAAEDVLHGETEVTDDLKKAISKLLEAYPPQVPPANPPTI